MPKKSTRITPKVYRRVKRVTKSPESLNDSPKGKFSASEKERSVRPTTARRTTGRTTASKRKADSPDKSSSSSSSNSSVDNEFQEERMQAPKKKRHVKEVKTATKNKKSTVHKQADNTSTKNISQKTERTRKPRIAKNTRKNRQTSDRIRDLIVTKNVYSKWKPLHSSTKNYIKQVIDDTLPKVIGDIVSDENKDEVQNCLSHLENSILVKMNKIKGPSQQPDYTSIEQESRKVEESLTSLNSQLSVIEDELQEQRRLLEIEEEKLKTLTLKPTKETNSTKNQPLHPFLRESFTPSLNLPALSKEALNLPIPKIPAEIDKGAQRLSKTISEISNTIDNIGLTHWLESVSQLQASLNRS